MERELGPLWEEGVSYLPWGPRPTSLAILPKVSLPEDLSSSNPSSGTEEGAEFRGKWRGGRFSSSEGPRPQRPLEGREEAGRGFCSPKATFLWGHVIPNMATRWSTNPTNGYTWVHPGIPRGQVGIPGNWQPQRGPQRALHLFSKHFLSILPRSRPF